MSSEPRRPGFMEHVEFSFFPEEWATPGIEPKMARWDGDAQGTLGILRGDYLVFEREREPATGDVILLARPIGEFGLARYCEIGRSVFLVPGSANIPGPIIVRRRDLHVLGVVTMVIRAYDPSILKRPKVANQTTRASRR